MIFSFVEYLDGNFVSYLKFFLADFSQICLTVHVFQNSSSHYRAPFLCLLFSILTFVYQYIYVFLVYCMYLSTYLGMSKPKSLNTKVVRNGKVKLLPEEILK
jgi:hypothetical protein